MIRSRTKTWPVILLSLPAFVAVWGGWVGLGEKTGFGVTNLLPGIVSDGGWATVNLAITLPIGLETYAAYALNAALNTAHRGALRTFAIASGIASLALGASGQLAFHVMESMNMERAPWWITAIVATIPVLVLGLGAALAALLRREELAEQYASTPSASSDATSWQVIPFAPYTPEAELALLTETAPVSPAPLATPRQRAPRGQWDARRVCELAIDGAAPSQAHNETQVATSTYARYVRAAKALNSDPRADIPQSWKVPAEHVHIMREMVSR